MHEPPEVVVVAWNDENGEEEEDGWCHPSQALASALVTVAKARRALKVAAKMMDAYAGAASVPRASKKDRLRRVSAG